MKKIVDAIKTRKEAEGNFAHTKNTETHRQWLLDAAESQIFCDVIEGLEKDDAVKRLSATDHPRNFPGDVRQAALEAFSRGGNWCPGIVGRKRHKVNVDAGDRIEFDHILPHVLGGSNSALNIQVLCSACNNEKRAKAS